MKGGGGGGSREINVDNHNFYRQGNEHFSQRMKEELQHLLYLTITVAAFCSSSGKTSENESLFINYGQICWRAGLDYCY